MLKKILQGRKQASRLAGAAAMAAAGLLIVSLKTPDRLSGPLTAAWNLLLIPAAMVVWSWLRPRSTLLVDAATASGVASSVIWAASALAGWGSPEPAWVALGMVWAVGIGWAMRRSWKWLGGYSLALGLAGALNLAVMADRAAAADWFFLGALRLPMLALWIGWLGVLLVARPEGERVSRHRDQHTGSRKAPVN